MKKKLIEAIKAKFVGIDDDTARRLAQRAISKGEDLSTDEAVAEAADAITLSDVLKSVRDYSADEAIKRYEETHPKEQGKKEDEGGDEGGNGGQGKDGQKDASGEAGGKSVADEIKGMLAALSKEMSEKIKGVADEVSAIKAGRVADGRRARLDEALKGLKDWQRKPYARIQVGGMSDDEFDTFVGEIREEVEEIVAKGKAEEASGMSPLLGGAHLRGEKQAEATDEEAKALFDKFQI